MLCVCVSGGGGACACVCVCIAIPLACDNQSGRNHSDANLSGTIKFSICPLSRVLTFMRRRL